MVLKIRKGDRWIFISTDHFVFYPGRSDTNSFQEVSEWVQAVAARSPAHTGIVVYKAKPPETKLLGLVFDSTVFVLNDAGDTIETLRPLKRTVIKSPKGSGRPAHTN